METKQLIEIQICIGKFIYNMKTIRWNPALNFAYADKFFIIYVIFEF